MDEDGDCTAYKQSIFSTLAGIALDPSSISCCDNSTIICNGTRIVEMNLGNLHFSGYIPSEIFNFQYLQKLDLSYNYLSGSFPSIEEENEVLLILKIQKNLLTGTLPTTITNLKNLAYFDASFNNFSGDLFSSISSMYGLRHLGVSTNQFKGEIPDEIGSFKKLQHLELSENSFYGTLPDTLCNLEDLEAVFLRENTFNGSLPSCLQNLTKLKYLYVEDNELSGSIPSIVSELSEFDFSGNQFTGYLPKDLPTNSLGRCLFPSSVCIYYDADFPENCDLITFSICPPDGYCVNTTEFGKLNPDICAGLEYVNPDMGIGSIYIFLIACGLIGIAVIIAICYWKLVFKFSTRIVQLMKCVPYKIELLYGTVSICLFIFGFILIPDVGDKEGLLGTISSNSSPLGLSTILSIFSTVNRIVLVSCATYSLSHVAWVMVYTSNYPISSIDAANLSITTSAKILFSMLKVKETRKLKFLILPFLIICLAAFSASESSIIQYLIKSEVESNPSSVSLQYRNTSLLSSRKFLTSKGVLTNAGVKLIYRALSDVQDHGSLQVSEMLYCPSHYLYCVGQVLIATDYQLNCTSNSTMITTFSESNASRTIDSSFDSSHQWTISRDISTALDEGRKSKRSIDVVTCLINDSYSVRTERSNQGTTNRSNFTSYSEELVYSPLNVLQELIQQYLIGSCTADATNLQALECDASLLTSLKNTTLGDGGTSDDIFQEMSVFIEAFFKAYMESAPKVRGLFYGVGYQYYTWVNKTLVITIFSITYLTVLMLVCCTFTVSKMYFKNDGTGIVSFIKYVDSDFLLELQSKIPNRTIESTSLNNRRKDRISIDYQDPSNVDIATEGLVKEDDSYKERNLKSLRVVPFKVI